MATVTNPQQAFNRVDADRRVRHPLSAVRGYIRRYVLLEGIALTVLYLALVFWIGLFIDYWPWKLFAFDWLWTADELSGSGATVLLRVVVLVAIVGGLVALIVFKVIRKLFKEFSDASVALLLEKRYPEQLGDRLITAVELSDPTLAQKYGYSQAMVDQTIRDAAERVSQLPVHEVFRWGMLRFKGVLALAATVGVFLIVGAGWLLMSGDSAGNFLIRFAQTGSIWAERNVLMADSYWPPSTYIELVRFPGKELGVPRDEERTDIKVRYARWTVAGSGPTAPRGWRPLRFSDLENVLGQTPAISLPVDWDSWIIDLDDLDAEVPPGAVPPEWNWNFQTSGFIKGELQKPEVKDALDRDVGNKARTTATRDKFYEMLNWRNWTVDKLEMQLAYEDPKSTKRVVAQAMKASYPKAYDEFQALFRELRELTGDASMARTLRHMQPPSEVTSERKSATGSGSSPCRAIEFNKFRWSLADLKESCKFQMVADDYTTPWRDINLVPPPMLDQMRIDKEEPAYLYYRYLENPAQLKERRQQVTSVSIATTGNRSDIKMPLGTTVAITAHSDRKLRTVRIAEPEKKREDPNSITVPNRVELAADRQTLTVSFPNVRRTMEFDFYMEDENGVKGRRPVLVYPVKDEEPKVNNLALGVPARELEAGTSKVKRYIVTPDAQILLRGMVLDDHGIARLQYKYVLEELEYQYLFADPNEKKEEQQPKDDAKKDEPKKEGNRVEAAKLILQGLQAPMGPYGLYAASYYGALTGITKEGSLRAPPRTEYVMLERSRSFFNVKTDVDLTLEEIDRLRNVQPGNRSQLAKALDPTSGRPTLEKILEEVKSENKLEGFLHEAMAFAGFAADTPQWQRLDQTIATDPVEVLAQVVKSLQPDEAARKLLEKQPEKAILKQFNLDLEDAVSGFDIQNNARFIKALGREDQKHYELKLSIVATDNNVFTGPGVRETGLPYSFLVVSENELLALMMVDQRRYADLLEKAIRQLEETRGGLEGQAFDFRKSPDDPTRLLLRLDAVRKALRDGGVVSKVLQVRFKTLLAEMTFNRMKKDRQDKIRTRVVEPLSALNTPKVGGFALTEEVANNFYKFLEPDANLKDKADLLGKSDAELFKQLEANKDKHLANADETLRDVSLLVRDLNAVLDAIKGGISEDEQTEILVQIEAEHRQATQTIREFEARFKKWVKDQLSK
jgi:hypothetical protein